MTGFDIHSLLIISAKAIIIYLFIVVAIRLFGKKELAQLSVIDLVFILLISNAVQNAMVGNDNSVPGGIAAATGLFVINYILKWLLKYIPGFGKAVQGECVVLIYKGDVKEKNLDKTLLTMDELEAAVREHGVKEIRDVDLAMLEVDGNISIMSSDYSNRTSRKRRAHRVVSKNT